MRKLFFFCTILFLFPGCKKEGEAKVEIYLLESFGRTINTATNPYTSTISDPVLSGTPLIADSDIAWYEQSTSTFRLKKDLEPGFRSLGASKAFAVTVNRRPVYYGVFHPAYMSSIVFGLATIDPVSVEKKELRINYVTLTGDPVLQGLDKRNDPQLVNALKASGRLR